MARRVHWTQDPRYSHLRNPPEWYHRYTGPFHTPRPSSRMEKQAAEERRRSWQSEWTFNAGDDKKDHFDYSCCEASFWPCGAYSRTSSRLRASLSGRDAFNVPHQGCCNPDCAQFALCLPFYGCFNAKLQNTVRTFYDIDGKDIDDWWDGCCCPCVTLPRNEREIMLREQQYRNLRALHDASDANQSYKPLPPMTLDNAFKVGSVREPSQPNIDKILPPIREVSREASIAGFTPQAATVADPSEKLDSATSKNEASENKAFPLLQYLNQLWYLVPAKKENAPPAMSQASGGSGIEESNGARSGQGLEVSPRVSVDNRPEQRSKFREHFLMEDEAPPAKLPLIRVTHHLDTDQMASKASPQLHGLDVDPHLVTSGHGNAHHGLGDHPLNASIPSTSEQPLDGYDDVVAPMTVQSHALATHEPSEVVPAQPSHAIDTDTKLGTKPRSKPHNIDMHNKQAYKVQRGIPHGLEDH